MMCVALSAQKLRNYDIARIAINVLYTCEILTLMCMELTSTMSLVNEIQDYVYRIENPKAMKCVQFVVNIVCTCTCVKLTLWLTLMCLEHISTMLLVNATSRFRIKLKVIIKFGAQRLYM